MQYNNVPGRPFRVMLPSAILRSIFWASAAAAALASVACEPTDSIACTLKAAGVRDPSSIISALSQAELHSMADVQELNGPEMTELFEGLRAAALIPLGNRARLRKAASVLPRTLHEHGDEHARHLQGSTPSTDGTDGISIEVAAIVFTGLVGMVGYIVQARSAQKASEAQARIEREADERRTHKDRVQYKLEHTRDLHSFTDAVNKHLCASESNRQLASSTTNALSLSSSMESCVFRFVDVFLHKLEHRAWIRCAECQPPHKIHSYAWRFKHPNVVS